MRTTTRRANKVKEMLYTKFRGNMHTLYGTANEEVSREEYTKYMHHQGKSNLKVLPAGLVISKESPWLAASPDGRVFDPYYSPADGLLELKNPSSASHMKISEAMKKKGFCLTVKEGRQQLDQKHDYYYQVQCQLYCTQAMWCDFVVRTEEDLYVERILRDDEWWQTQLPKLEKFYFTALLPELACPRYHAGGIREPVPDDCAS